MPLQVVLEFIPGNILKSKNMTIEELFAKFQAIMADRAQPNKLVGTIGFLIVLLAISAIPFIGLPIAVIIFVLTVLSLLNSQI